MSYVFNPFTGTLDNVGTSAKKLEEELALYFKLAGRATAQKAIFGTGAGAEGRLESTSNATKGKILFGTSAYEEAKNFLGIGTKAPTAYLQVEGPKAELFQEAPSVLKVTGAEGGEAFETEAGGAGSAITVTGGKGGPSTVVGFVTSAGGGGGATFTGGAGGVAKGANTAENAGGPGAGFSFVGGVGGAALNSSANNAAGQGGALTFSAGNGGNAEGAAGTRRGGRGGTVTMSAGTGGTGTTSGGLGGSFLIEAGKNNSSGTGGLLQLKAGLGAAGIAGGNIEFLTYKEASTVGAELEITAAGEYIFKKGEVMTNVVAPIEVLAGRTYEVPSNVQGLFKENIKIQGTLNIQGRFDEVYTVEPESIETAQIRNGAVTEAKAELPEMVTKGTTQTITGAKTFTHANIQQLSEVEELTFKTGGILSFFEMRWLVGSSVSGTKLKQLKVTGKNENYAGFEESPTDTGYAMIPEGGAAEITSAKFLTKRRVIFLVNISKTETLTLVHEGAGLATNKFFFASGKNVKLEPGQVIMLWYIEGEENGEKGRWRDVGGSSVNLTGDGWAPVGVPTEIPAAKTYEVPALISSLWRDNISVQGTMNVQGRLTEV